MSPDIASACPSTRPTAARSLGIRCTATADLDARQSPRSRCRIWLSSALCDRRRTASTRSSSSSSSTVLPRNWQFRASCPYVVDLVVSRAAHDNGRACQCPEGRGQEGPSASGSIRSKMIRFGCTSLKRRARHRQSRRRGLGSRLARKSLKGLQPGRPQRRRWLPRKSGSTGQPRR